MFLVKYLQWQWYFIFNYLWNTFFYRSYASNLEYKYYIVIGRLVLLKAQEKADEQNWRLVYSDTFMRDTLGMRLEFHLYI
jgi:hypothetical protein